METAGPPQLARAGVCFSVALVWALSGCGRDGFDTRPTGVTEDEVLGATPIDAGSVAFVSLLLLGDVTPGAPRNDLDRPAGTRFSSYALRLVGTVAEVSAPEVATACGLDPAYSGDIIEAELHPHS